MITTMENNRTTTGGENTGVPAPTQGSVCRRGATTPLTMADASGAARRMREQQKALKEILHPLAKMVKEQEAERQKKKEEEAKAKAAAKAAEGEKRKKEAWAKEHGKSFEDATMDNSLGMDDWEEAEDNESMGDEGRKDNRGGLEEVVRYLEREKGDGVYWKWFHLHKVFGILLPPPKMSRFNLPCLTLYTGLRHGFRASNLRKPTIFTCGSRHQPRAPNLTLDSFWMTLALAEGVTAADQTVDSCWTKLALAEGAAAVDIGPD